MRKILKNMKKSMKMIEVPKCPKINNCYQKYLLKPIVLYSESFFSKKVAILRAIERISSKNDSRT
jgi:hypothetical protein